MIRATITISFLVINELVFIVLPDIYLYLYPDTYLAGVFYILVMSKGKILKLFPLGRRNQQDSKNWYFFEDNFMEEYPLAWNRNIFDRRKLPLEDIFP